MKRYNLAPDEYLHIYNRGVSKQPIFFSERDRKRFLFLILLLQTPADFKNSDRMFKEFVKNPTDFLITQNKTLADRYVELISFCCMPNHFHLIVREIKEGGISKYMQRVLNAHTKYINIKYERSGHLFQGPYQALSIESNKQLLHLSCYIHRNSREIREWRNKEVNFPWSSYQDFALKNRWGDFLKHEIITSQFSIKKNDYADFVSTSLTKETNFEPI